MSTIREAIIDYIDMRRSLGFKMNDARSGLLAFAAFMEERQAPSVTVELALEWAQLPADVQPSHLARRLSIVRAFARHRRAADPSTEVPPSGLLPYRPKRARPHIYSDEEIRMLLQAALDMTYRCQQDGLHPWTYHCLFGLLAVTGMRLGEALNLELRDVDLDAGVLTVRGAKFGKDRLVPLHGTACEVLADYTARRERHWQGRPVSPFLFVSNRGNRLGQAEINRTFHKLSRRIGLRGEADSRGPRLHDLRHSFAMKTLTGWHRRGQDAERLLPVLSTWLGHAKVEDTQWYLEASPELMGEAVRRLEGWWEGRP